MRSLVDNVVPLTGRRIWFVVIVRWPLFIAFLTTLVNDGSDATDGIDPFCALTLVVDKTLPLVEDVVSDFDEGSEFVDDELVITEDFDWSVETASANGVHRRFGAVRIGAKNKWLNYLLYSIWIIKLNDVNMFLVYFSWCRISSVSLND